jgi:hypothetical protein
MCEERGRRFDMIFSFKIESVGQERKLLTKWLKSLCKNCKRILVEEGSIVEE